MVSDDIGGLLRKVAEGIDADLTMVIGQAARRGHRLRARRRAAIAMTAVVSAAAAVVAVTVGAGLVHGPAHGPAQGPHPAAGHRHGRLAHLTGQRPRQAHGPGMTRRQMLAVLRPMLPAGWKITYVSAQTSRGAVEINFTDGHGAADILLDVHATEYLYAPASVPAKPKPQIKGSRATLSCPNPPWRDEGRRPAGALPISCRMRKLADGSVERDTVTYADVASYYGYLIHDIRPDGITVSIQVGNGTLDGTPHLARAGWPYVDRARPPGSMALWISVVESPMWHL